MPGVQVAEHETLNSLFDAVALAEADREALVAGSYRLSYAELRSLVLQCAAALLARGIRPGDRVGMFSAPRPESVILFWACAHIGAIFVGFGTRYREQELRYVVSDAGPVLLFGVSSFENDDCAITLQNICNECGVEPVMLEPWRDDRLADGFGRFLSRCPQGPAPPPRVGPGAAVTLIYTSGSTGRPKGVVLSHANVLAMFEGFVRRWPMAHPRILGFMPIDHIGSIGSNVVAPVVYGGTLVQRERFDAGDILRAIEEEAVTLWPSAIPTMFVRLLEHPGFAQADLSSVELVWWTGPVPISTLTALKGRVKGLATSYGMTEIAGAATLSDINPPLEILSRTVGRPMDGIDVGILADSAISTEPGVSGEIVVRGRSLMQGYWRRPDETSKVMLPDRWMRTGDVGAFQEDGTVAIVGRIKEMIRSGGYNIAPAEVEDILAGHPDVSAAAVVGLPNELYGETVNAVVTTRGECPAEADDLLRWCRERLSNFKVPKRILVWRSLPLLPNGKIDKRRIVDRLRETT